MLCVLVGKVMQILCMPLNDFVVSVLNTFKKRGSHLLPTSSTDGVKMVVLDEIDVELKLSRIENDMLKLKLQQAEEVKNKMKRVARLYKCPFVLSLCLFLYVHMLVSYFASNFIMILWIHIPKPFKT